ncbi:MAG: DUF3592 domain-containing protein [Synergistaceae bacterium]|nr:DUF3592 domain-containing protein [Synergistaceae bacterium]
MINFTVSFFKKRRAFRERGIRVQATVVHYSESKGRRRSTIYTYTMEYMLKGERQTAACQTYNWHEVGETVEAAYLPEDPKQAMLAEDFAETDGNTLHGCAYVFGCAITLFILLSFVRQLF